MRYTVAEMAIAAKRSAARLGPSEWAIKAYAKAGDIPPMRLPRFRLRTLMIVVAMAALGLGIWHRRETLNAVANYHKSQVHSLKSFRLTHMDGNEVYSAAPERIPA